MPRKSEEPDATGLSSTMDDLHMAAMDSDPDGFSTGRYIVTFREDALDSGIAALGDRGLSVADARDFDDQAVAPADVAGADALVFPEIGSAVVSGTGAQSGELTAASELAADGPIEAIEPEYMAYADQATGTEAGTEFLRGFNHATQIITRELFNGHSAPVAVEDEETLVLGATWGLIACRVPQSTRSGGGIKVAVLDTGMDLGHPDFAGRSITTRTFVGQPVQDLHSHGTHCIGTACGPKAPPGATPRYGIGYRTAINAGKVLSNTGSGATAGVLSGINWAVANRCQVISLSLGSQAPEQAAYTAAGRAALSNGLLIVAAAGNDAKPTGSPANSPTIFAVASLDQNLAPSSFSNFGKIEIAAPGRDVFSSVPRPARYGTKSGTSMATPHVAGCAALWAETSASMRGLTLWRKLQATARRLPYPASRVGAGLVQAP